MEAFRTLVRIWVLYGPSEQHQIGKGVLFLGFRRMEEQNGESENKVAQAGGKLQGEVLADEFQGAGNVEAKKVNDPVDQAIEDAKEFGGYQAPSAEVIEKIAADRNESIEKGRAADDVTDASKDELGWDDVTDESKDERSKGAEIEEPGFGEQGNGLDAKGAEAPSKVEAAIVRQELEPELSKVLDLESAPAKKSGLLALALRFLPNAQNLDSWVSGIAIGIVTSGLIVVLWDNRRKA